MAKFKVGQIVELRLTHSTTANDLVGYPKGSEAEVVAINGVDYSELIQVRWSVNGHLSRYLHEDRFIATTGSKQSVTAQLKDASNYYKNLMAARERINGFTEMGLVPSPQAPQEDIHSLPTTQDHGRSQT